MADDAIVHLRKSSQRYAYSSIQLQEAIARKAGFTGTEHKYLGFFLQKGTLTAGELATLTGLTTGAVTGLIDRFERKSLVKRQFDANDRRKVLIVPDSEKIRALFGPYYQDFQAKTENLIATFSTSEMDVIESFLAKSLALMHETINSLQ